MIKEMYKTGFNWCFKYGKGAVSVLFVGLFLEISKELVNKYFGININDIFLPEHFSVYGSILFCLIIFIEAWVSLEFLSYIYKGETEEKYDFILFDKAKPYMIPAFMGAFMLNITMLLLMNFITLFVEMMKLSERFAGVFLMITVLVLLLFILPLWMWFYLRLSFYFEAIIVNSMKDPILAFKESFKITKGRVWDIIRVVVLPVVLVAIVFIVVISIIQKDGCPSCDFIGFASAIIQPLLIAVGLALYIEFRKNPIKEPENEEQMEE